MIDHIIDWSVHHRALVCLIVGVLVFLGLVSIRYIPLDALPDLSDTQVIVQASWDVSADIMNDQLTTPLVSSLLSLPKVRDIRASSTFGAAWIYVIFEDDVDIYWARSRLSEYLSSAKNDLPGEIQLGPDATGVGWVYQYVLIDQNNNYSLHELRSWHDNYLKLHLAATPGVAEVASFGGLEKQLEVQVDPTKLREYGLSIQQVARAVQASNQETGARVLESAGSRYMIRLRGYVKSREDLQNSVVHSTQDGAVVLVKDVAHVSLTPRPRHNVGDYNGMGDAVGGVVVMRHGEDAYRVTTAILDVISHLRTSLPEGWEIVETYNRHHLIVDSLKSVILKLLLEIFVVALIILVFLLHFPSALIPIISLPCAIIISMILVYLTGVTMNIMTLGGIAIAMGAMVDASLVMIENCHKRLSGEVFLDGASKRKVMAQAIKDVAPSSFYALMIIAISFLPIFFLERQEGRLFQPLAYSKTYAMMAAALLSITLTPALCGWFFGGKWGAKLLSSRFSERNHPITRRLFRLYSPAVLMAIRHRKKVIFVSLALVLMSLPLYQKLGREFIPTLNEGTLLYMPTTLPGISLAEARQALQKQDEILNSFPEVVSVHGKAGRADTATDPAPLSMFETVVVLKDQRQWRQRERWYSNYPLFLHWVFEIFWPKQISYEELIQEMDQKMVFPGFLNAWTQPIKGRIDMLATGIRTPVGLKISGEDPQEIERIAEELETRLGGIEGTRSAFADRIGAGHYLDVDFSRELLAHHGLTIVDAHQQLSAALSGQKSGEVIDKQDRYPIVVRYLRGSRDNIEHIRRVYLRSPLGHNVPVHEVASVRHATGPSVLKNDMGYLTGYVFLDLSTPDIGEYVERVKQVLAATDFPTGYTVRVVGQYESMERVSKKLQVVIPVVLFLILLMITLHLKSVAKTTIIVLAIPFSLMGAIGLVYLLNFPLSIAVWVGMVALVGIDIETAMFMLLYLDLAYEKMKKAGRMNHFDDLSQAIHDGAAKRLRPKFMMVLTTILALLPILLANQADSGSDMMKRMVAPMVGGMTTSFILELFVYPALYALWKERDIETK